MSSLRSCPGHCFPYGGQPYLLKNTVPEDDSSSSASLFGDACLDVSSSATSSLMYSEDDASCNASQIPREKRISQEQARSPDGASMTSDESFLLSDRYFQESSLCPEGPIETTKTPIISSGREEETSESVRINNGKKCCGLGRNFLRTSRPRRRRSSKRSRKLTGIFQRVLRSFQRPKTIQTESLDQVRSVYTAFRRTGRNQDDSRVLSPPTQVTSWCLNLDPGSHKDRPASTTDSISEISGSVEVWTLDSPSYSSVEECDGILELLPSPLPASLSVAKEEHDDGTPEGLRSRAPLEEIIRKLRLASRGWTAVKNLRDAAAARADVFDPFKPCPTPTEVATMRVSGALVPDYDSYVRLAVTNFCQNVLGVSNDTYAALLQKDMGIARRSRNSTM